MAPQTLDTILRPPQWPTSFSDFVTWCLMWDPNTRPTSTQALAHGYFKDAQDPLSSLTTTKTLSTPTVPQYANVVQRPCPAMLTAVVPAPAPPPKPSVDPTRINGLSNAGPIPILPTIRPISLLSNAVTREFARKIGRQLSTNSQTNHYVEVHRQEAERSLNGQSGLTSGSGRRESFFSHLRKRARRISRKYQAPFSPSSDDIEANANSSPCQTNSNRQSMVINGQAPLPTLLSNHFSDLDKALQNVRQSLEASSQTAGVPTNGLSSPHASNTILEAAAFSTSS